MVSLIMDLSVVLSAFSLLFLAEIEIAEAGQLDLLASLQRGANLLEERFDHILGLALVQAQLLVEIFGHVCLGQCHLISLFNVVCQLV